MLRVSLVAVRGGLLPSCLPLRCFSRCRAQALVTLASVVAACGFGSCGSWALELRLSSCGPQALLLRGMWDLPAPGIKHMSPALAGRFLSTTRKSILTIFQVFGSVG